MVLDDAEYDITFSRINIHILGKAFKPSCLVETFLISIINLASSLATSMLGLMIASDRKLLIGLSNRYMKEFIE